MRGIWSKWPQGSTYGNNVHNGQVVSTKNIWIRSQRAVQEALQEEKPRSAKGKGIRRYETCKLCGKRLKADERSPKDDSSLHFPRIHNRAGILAQSINNDDRETIKRPGKQPRRGKKRSKSKISMASSISKCDFPSHTFGEHDFCRCGEIRSKIKSCPNSMLREDRDPEVVEMCRFPVLEDKATVYSTVKRCSGREGDKILTATYMAGQSDNHHLSLSNHGMDESWGHVLSDQISTSPWLTSVDLSGNSLGEGGVNMLCRSLLYNTSIKTLDLADNGLGNTTCLSAIAKVLDYNGTLEYLCLSRNQLSDLDVEPMISACSFNSSLKTLDLNSNRLGQLSAEYIRDMLKNNSTLIELNIGCNEIGPTGTLKIFQGIQANVTLQKLSIGANNIGDRGMDELNNINTLGVELAYLDLADNFISDYGLGMFSYLLLRHNNLHALRLDENSITSTGILAFLKKIAKLREIILTDLYIGNIFLDEQVRNVIKEIKQKAKNFRVHGGYGVERDSSSAFRVLDSYLQRHSFLEGTGLIDTIQENDD